MKPPIKNNNELSTTPTIQTNGLKSVAIISYDLTGLSEFLRTIGSTDIVGLEFIPT